MIRSMTGFGEAERDSPAGRLRLEVRTVNHRFFNASLKTPSGYQRHEREIVDALKRHLPRGHVSAYLAVDALDADGEPRFSVDLEAARRHKALLETLAEGLGLERSVSLDLLLRLPGLPPLFHERVDEADPVPPETLVALAEDAARAVAAQREAEGARLQADLEERLAAIEALLAEVETRAPERLVAERDRLRAAIRELAEGVPLDEERLAREVAMLADKWDVNEEVVRFRSHAALFREALEGDGAEPVGKRLGFLVQEMHREANTIGSKANDARIAQAAVALKEEVEKIREQVENVE